MQNEFALLLKNMLADIDSCMQQAPSEKKGVESSYWIAINYWEKCKALINEKGFKDEEEEIDFFRNVKPQFTSYIQYSVMLIGALEAVSTIIPGIAAISARNFWEGESKTFKRFYDKNVDFINYYESGRRDRDGIYFRRVNTDWDPRWPQHSYDSDRNFCSPFDQLVRSLLAQKKFHEYCINKIEESTQPPEGYGGL